MSIQNARPTLWSKMILRALNTLLVYNGPDVISRDYEGEIREAGDSVKIISIGDPEVRSYTKDTDITMDNLVDAAQTLVIDQQDYFNFQLDNIDRVQSVVPLLEEAARRAAYKLRKKADEFTAKGWESAGSEVSSFKRSTAEAVYNNIVEAGVKLDETDTPDDGKRFIILPPSCIANLQKDIRFVGYGTTGNRAQLEGGLPPATNGFVGYAANFRVYQSNDVPEASTKFKCCAGHPIAWTFAEQISKVEAYSPEKRFAEAIKGLHVYGGKVVRPAQLVKVVIENN